MTHSIAVKIRVTYSVLQDLHTLGESTNSRNKSFDSFFFFFYCPLFISYSPPMSESKHIGHSRLFILFHSFIALPLSAVSRGKEAEHLIL